MSLYGTAEARDNANEARERCHEARWNWREPPQLAVVILGGCFIAAVCLFPIFMY